MTEMQRDGLKVDVPPGWDGRIFVRPEHGAVGAASADGAPAPAGEHTFPVVHVATIPLPGDMGDYGSGAVEQLGPVDALVVLKEFDPADSGSVLFANEGLPRRLDPDTFDVAGLQRQLPGQAGLQRFFRESGRGFCLYVVIGAFQRRHDIVPRVNSVLGSITIDPLPPPPPSGP